MRKFLLLTMMCFFALCGTLNAQDTIQVGTKTNTDSSFPMNTYYNYSYSQQIFTAEEINHAPGFISEIAFFTSNTKYSREVTIYMINTDKESFSSREDWVYVGISDIVYEGFVSCNSTLSIPLTNNFEYTGGNILLCLQDRTGKEDYYTSFDVASAANERAIYMYTDNSMITPENVSTRINEQHWEVVLGKNVVQLIFAAEEKPVEGAPATPTNVTAEAVSQTEIALSWDVVQDAVSYNVYDDKGSVLDNVTETSYTVEDLEAETNYCFKVSALNDSLESPASVKVCATTLRNPEIIVNLEEVELGDIILGDFWSENNDKSVALSLECIETEITNVECDNEFFVLPEVIDFTANPVTFDVTYNKETLAVGEKTAELVITHTHGNVSIPMSANVYAPETPDVFELAQEITLQDGTFSATPDFENLHDNYNLPNEVNVGNTPDAVYSFELDKEQAVTVDVTGTNGIYAIYKAEDMENAGPKADNNYAGESGASSTFFYDFSEENVLDNFTLLDKDGDGYNWHIVPSGITGASVASRSWQSGVGALTPNNYIVTKEKYAIKSTSKLSFKYSSSWTEKIGVEISTDGVTFTNIWSDEGKFGVKTAEISLAGYEGQELYIALRHYECTDGDLLQVDNLSLENSDGDFVTFPAGKYYLVAAAENAFTVNMTVGANPADLPAAPQNLRVDNVTATSVTLSWDAVAEAQSYNVYEGTKLVADNITATTYTVENLEAFTEYTFSVRSFDGEYTSFSSAEVHATTIDFAITAPQNVAVTVLDAFSVKVSWDAVENATSYNVYQDNAKIASGLTTTTLTVENLDPATEYCFVVSALRRDIEEKAAAVCGTTSAIDFNADNLATEFMFDFNDQSFEGLRTIDADGDGNNWILTTAEQGYENTYAARSYSYYGQAFNPDNYLVTKAPYIIDATSKVSLNARIGYEMDMFKGEHYAVVVSENGKDWTVVFEETLEHTDWTNTSVSLEAYAGKAVLVGVRHYNCTDLSFLRVDNFALTSDVEPIEPVVVPNAPTNLKAEAINATSIKLTWDAVENATSYKVYRGMIDLGEVFETTCIAVGLSPETNYCFTVTALNEAGESAPSEQVCEETLEGSVTPDKPEAPKNLVAEATSPTTITLTWDPVEGAIGYGINCFGTYLGSTSDVTVKVTKLEPDTEYCFTVITITEMTEIDGENYITGCSDDSEEACATTPKEDAVEELASLFNIYPNPVENELFIETEMIVEEIAIYDVYGRQTMCQQVNETTSQQVVDVADLKAGVYFVKIVTDNGEVVKRFVKK